MTLCVLDPTVPLGTAVEDPGARCLPSFSLVGVAPCGTRFLKDQVVIFLIALVKAIL